MVRNDQFPPGLSIERDFGLGTNGCPDEVTVITPLMQSRFYREATFLVRDTFKTARISISRGSRRNGP
jgi:hypothetical protein